MRLAIKVVALGILTSAIIVLLRIYVGLDGSAGVFIVLAGLPTSLLVRQLQPEYPLIVLFLGQSVIWGCVWLLILSKKPNKHENPEA